MPRHSHCAGGRQELKGGGSETERILLGTTSTGTASGLDLGAVVGRQDRGRTAEGVLNPFINGGGDLNLAATSRESATERGDGITRKGTDSGLVGDDALVVHSVGLGAVEGVGMFGHGGAALGTSELGNDSTISFGLVV